MSWIEGRFYVTADKVDITVKFISLNLPADDLIFHSTEQLQNIHEKLILQRCDKVLWKQCQISVAWALNSFCDPCVSFLQNICTNIYQWLLHS